MGSRSQSQVRVIEFEWTFSMMWLTTHEKGNAFYSQIWVQIYRFCWDDWWYGYNKGGIYSMMINDEECSCLLSRVLRQQGFTTEGNNYV